MEEKEVYKLLTPNTTVPLIQTEDVYDNLKKLVSITPNMWEDFFKTISQIPQYFTVFYKRCIVIINKLFKWFLSWLTIAIMEEISFTHTYKTNKIWDFIASNDRIVGICIFKNTIYERFNINKIYDDHVYFNYLIKEEIIKNREKLIKDCAIIIEHIDFIEKNDVINMWNKLQKNENAKYEYFDSSFDSFYNYIRSNDNNIEKIKKLIE